MFARPRCWRGSTLFCFLAWLLLPCSSGSQSELGSRARAGICFSKRQLFLEVICSRLCHGIWSAAHWTRKLCKNCSHRRDRGLIGRHMWVSCDKTQLRLCCSRRLEGTPDRYFHPNRAQIWCKHATWCACAQSCRFHLLKDPTHSGWRLALQ